MNVFSRTDAHARSPDGTSIANDVRAFREGRKADLVAKRYGLSDGDLSSPHLHGLPGLQRNSCDGDIIRWVKLNYRVTRGWHPGDFEETHFITAHPVHRRLRGARCSGMLASGV